MHDTISLFVSDTPSRLRRTPPSLRDEGEKKPPVKIILDKELTICLYQDRSPQWGPVHDGELDGVGSGTGGSGKRGRREQVCGNTLGPSKGWAIRMGDTGLVSSMSALSSMGSPALTGGS